MIGYKWIRAIWNLSPPQMTEWVLHEQKRLTAEQAAYLIIASKQIANEDTVIL